MKYLGLVPMLVMPLSLIGCMPSAAPTLPRHDTQQLALDSRLKREMTEEGAYSALDVKPIYILGPWMVATTCLTEYRKSALFPGKVIELHFVPGENRVLRLRSWSIWDDRDVPQAR